MAQCQRHCNGSSGGPAGKRPARNSGLPDRGHHPRLGQRPDDGGGYVDLLIPRGGAGLIRACMENAKVPCIQTGTGICHIFVDASAEQDKALDIIENAKASRPSVCNAEEVCLVHRDIAAEFLPKLARRLGPDRTAKGLHPVELRLDRVPPPSSRPPCRPADFDTEFLDYILAIKIVDNVEEPSATSPRTPPATAKPS